MSEKLFIGQQTLHIPHLTPGEGPRLSKGLSQARIGAVPANSIKDNEETADSLRPLLNKQRLVNNKSSVNKQPLLRK